MIIKINCTIETIITIKYNNNSNDKKINYNNNSNDNNKLQ